MHRGVKNVAIVAKNTFDTSKDIAIELIGSSDRN